MSTLLRLARWELRLQLRSPRFKTAVLLYFVLPTIPSAVLFSLSRTQSLSPAAFLENLLEGLPFLTIVLAVLVAGHRSGTASWPETWTVLSSAALGNAGYLLGRWLAMIALLVPISAVPLLLTAALALAAEGGSCDVLAWAGSWAFRIAPLVFLASALWLGLVTVLGSELAALGGAFVLTQLFLAILNQILFLFRFFVRMSLTLGAFDDFRVWVATLGNLLGLSRDFDRGIEASEAPFDARSVADWMAPRLGLVSALALLVLALGVLYVRRTKRDIKPRRIRDDHPLRSYLALFLRLREHLTPTAAPSRADRMSVLFGVSILALGLGWSLDRQNQSQRLAEARQEAGIRDSIAPTATEIVPQSWKIRGSVEPSGGVALEVRSALRNGGTLPQSRLAFSLNEHLEVIAIEAPGRRVAAERAWDRVGLEITPSIAPGETLELRWHLTGVPGTTHFPLLGFASDTFFTRIGRFQTASFPRELSDLSWSRRQRAATPRRIALEARHLAPVPRYTPWSLRNVDRGSGSQLEIPSEVVSPEAELTVDLEAPASVFLGDACGHASEVVSGRSRVRGSCRMPLADYEVVGGPLVTHREGGLLFATLEAHREKIREYSESLARVARMSAKAWPGMGGVEGLVVVEWLPGFQQRNFDRRWMWGYDLKGKLLLIPESSLVHGSLGLGSMFIAERLVASILTRDLIARRGVEASQELFFREMYGALMLLRMGVSRQQDATVSGQPTLEQVLSKPLLEGNDYSWQLWLKRMPAVLVDLEHRMGAKSLYAALETFLDGPADELGSVEELRRRLEEESGLSLARFFEDFVAGGALPKLALADVEVHRGAREFRVEGKLENSGSGQVHCPVLIKTDLNVIRTRVTVDAQASSPFAVRTRARPHTVELDPEGTCHRLVTKLRAAAEHVDLLEKG